MSVPAAAVAGAVEAARRYLRTVGGGEGELLADLARTAFDVGERFTGRLFVERAVEDVLPASPRWARLRAEPVNMIAGVTGLPAGAAPFVLPVDAYAVDIDGEGRGWVRVVAPGAAVSVAVQYRAGLATGWGDLPADLAQGLVALVAYLHDDRTGAGFPAATAALWRPWRRLRLAEPVR